jgi:antitoxin MazE
MPFRLSTIRHNICKRQPIVISRQRKYIQKRSPVVTIKVQKWGKGLAIRIPSAYAKEISLQEGSQVIVRVVNGSLVVQLLSKTVPTLEDLVSGITPENRHEEVDWGRPVGREIW